MRFKVLMMDLDGVICRRERQDGRIEPTYGLSRGTIQQIAFSSDLFALAVTGQITDEAWRLRMENWLQLLIR